MPRGRGRATGSATGGATGRPGPQRAGPGVTHPDVLAALADLPPLQSCAVPIHPDRRAVVVPDPAGDLVAMVWSAESLPVRRANRARIAALAGRISRGSAPVSAPDVPTVLHVEGGDPWVLAPHHGTTVEDLLRDSSADPTTRHALVATLAAASSTRAGCGRASPRGTCSSSPRAWCSSTSRNASTSTLTPSAQRCLLWHELFFADPAAARWGYLSA
ncbi:MAG: hypothetical protein ACRDRH_09080 [Pseudonocardia sp.]